MSEQGKERLDRLVFHAKKRLSSLMSEYSEQVYSAGWHIGLEFVLWAKTKKTVVPTTVCEMRELSELVDGWFYWDPRFNDEELEDDDSEEPTFVSMDEWLRLFADHERIL